MVHKGKQCREQKKNDKPSLTHGHTERREKCANMYAADKMEADQSDVRSEAQDYSKQKRCAVVKCPL